MTSNVSLERRDIGLAIALFLLLSAIGAGLVVPGVVGVFHDGGIYVATAKALESGHGYRMIDLPGDPLQTKYPVVFPALLALIWAVAPSLSSAATAMQWLTLICGAAAVSVLFLYLVRFQYADRSVALAAAILMGCAPYFLYLNTQVVSESLFSALLVLGLWWVEIATDSGAARGRSQLKAGFGLALIAMCRLFGLTAIAATALSGILRRRLFMPSLLIPLGACMLWSAWAIWGRSDTPSVENGSYYTTYSASISGHVTASSLTLNTLKLLTDSGGAVLFGSLARLGGPGLALAPAFFAVGVLLWLGVARSALSGRVLPLLLLCYGALMIVWPWPDARFIVPIVGLLSGLGWQRGLSALRRAAASVGRIAAIVCTTLALAGATANLTADMTMLQARRHYGFPYDFDTLASARAAGTPLASWSSFEEIFAWTRTHTERADVIAAADDPLIYLYTDRKTIRPVLYLPEAVYQHSEYPIGTPDQIKSLLRAAHVRYFMRVPLTLDSQVGEVLEMIRTRDPGFMRLVYQGADARFQVFEISRQ